MYNKRTNIVFYELCLIFFSEMVSYPSDSPYKMQKNKMLYKIKTAKW